MRWILLIYKVPSAPARHRIAVWRKLKRLGAVYLQKSVAVLPDTAYLRDELLNLAHDIENFHGEATIVFTRSIEKEEKMVAKFREQTNKEYEKIIARGNKLLEIISTRGKQRKIKELETALDELKQKLVEAQRRDYFEAKKRREADRFVRDCEERYLWLLRKA